MISVRMVLTIITLAYFYIGANPSAEEGEEALEDGAKQVLDVVDSFRLQQTSFDKKSFMIYLKARDSFTILLCMFYEGNFSQGYMKAVKSKLQETNPERVDAFEKGASKYAKKIIANFDDYEFVRSDVCVVVLQLKEYIIVVHRRINESRWHGCTSELPSEI